MKTKKLFMLMTAVLALAACGDDGEDIVIDKNTNKKEASANINRNTDGPNEAKYRLEFPHLKGGNNVVIVHRAVMNNSLGDVGVNYCVEWNPSINAQRWSCYQLYSSINYNTKYNVSRYNASNDGSLSASCQYPNDQDLSPTYQMTADPYKYNNFDHGHICPSADRLRSTESNYQTFFITNMQPQYSNFNGSNSNSSINDRSPWFRLESQIRTWASANMSDTLFVVKGGTIDSSNQIIKYLTDKINGQNKIPVPKYFFVALLSKKGTRLASIGFWMEHIENYSNKQPLSAYAKSIDELERLTGIDFFCNLPDDEEDTVERSYSASLWSGLQ